MFFPSFISSVVYDVVGEKKLPLLGTGSGEDRDRLEMKKKYIYIYIWTQHKIQLISLVKCCTLNNNDGSTVQKLIYSDVHKTFTALSTPHVSTFTVIFNHHSPRSWPNSPVIDRELWVRLPSPSY